MPIPPRHQHRFIYHFTHLQNLPGVIRNGLLAPNEQSRLGLRHKTIALQDIQDRRAETVVPCGPGGVVHDYVPFYFCSFSSMLLSVVNAKNVDQMHLIYLAVPISVIDRADVIFSNASANTVVPPDFFSDPEDLARLDWTAIDSLKWSLGNSRNQARMAEVLLHHQVTIGEVDHIIVWNESIKKKVERIFAIARVAPLKIRFQGPPGKYHYVMDYPLNPTKSLVTGPYMTRIEYENAVKEILGSGKDRSAARFENTKEMLVALRGDLASLPETAELVGLESDNEVHKENVGNHTLSVVRGLTRLDEFAALDGGDRETVELAAFLHDIGKGPKSRWAWNRGKQKADRDHPIKSVKMLVRILTEEVKAIDPVEAKVLAKLICYHDLVGDILGRGRNPEQLEKIAESERELDMLIALGMADMRAVNANWYNNNVGKVSELRERILTKLNSGTA